MGKLLIVLLVAGTCGLSVLTIAANSGNSSSKPPAEITVHRIVAQLEPLRELSTLRVRVSGIIHGTQEGSRFWQGTSRMVLIVRGAAIYGIDLSSLQVEVEAPAVHLHLPQPRVTDAWVDVERSVIWQRKNGRFRDERSLDLESVVWSEARSLVARAAYQQHHIEQARDQAERVIRAILHAAEPDLKVKIVWRMVDSMD